VPSVFLEETIWLALPVIVAGGVSGILAVLFGIGGGAVIVRALYEVFRILDVPEGVRMQLCIGTSLAIMVPTSVHSYLAHPLQRDRRHRCYFDAVTVCQLSLALLWDLW
jgi:uncharacterized protein